VLVLTQGFETDFKPVVLPPLLSVKRFLFGAILD
jgi:hypothetical protein